MLTGPQLRTEREYTGSFRSNISKEVEDRFEEWAKHLPKTLWELGASNLETTEVHPRPDCFSLREEQRALIQAIAQVIARFLSRLFQRRACRPETTKLICTRFTPYFSVTHPTRGALPGPLFKLPTAHRKLVLDVMALMLHDQDVKACAGEFLGTLEGSLTGQDEKGYWNQIQRRG